MTIFKDTLNDLTDDATSDFWPKADNIIEVLGSGAATVLALTHMVKESVFAGTKLPYNFEAETRVCIKSCGHVVIDQSPAVPNPSLHMSEWLRGPRPT